MPIFGADCSDFDWGRGPMDVASMRRDGIDFFTHKATEGTKVQHVHYGQALNRARDCGMPCMGAYMIPRSPGNNGHGSIAQQVDYFLAYLDSQTPWWRSTAEFFIQVDTEHWGYDDVAPQYGAQACALLKQQTGKFVIHYAPRWAYGDTIPGDDPLWASSYGSNPAVPYRQAYPGDASSGWAAYSGRTPLILQYGSRLTVGSQPSCDVNAFRGTLDQFRALVEGADMITDDDWNQIWKRLVPNPSNGQQTFVIDFLTYGNNAAWAALNAATAAGQKVDALTAIAQQLLTAQGADKTALDALMAKVQAIGQPSDTQIQGMADRITSALIASNANGLTPADHAAVVADVRQALAAAAKAEADALAAG